MTSKNCSRSTCKQQNPQLLVNFNKNKNSKDGLQFQCKYCQKAYSQSSKAKDSRKKRESTFEFKNSQKEYNKSSKRVEYLKKYYKIPEVSQKRKNKQRSPESKQYQKEYNNLPKRQKSQKERRMSIKYIKRKKANNLRAYWPNSTVDQAQNNYNELLIQQKESCAICSRHQSEFKKGLCVDHCHYTGIIRGLLCGPCNTAIGLLKENFQILDNAKKYLIKYCK